MAVLTTFSITNSGNNYLVDGVQAASITVVRGKRYVLSVNASGHPLFIQTAGNGYNAATVYTDGVSGNGTQVGSLSFTVPEDAPDTLYYQCQYHSMMYGLIVVTDAGNRQSFTEIDSYSPTLEDLVDKSFYGLRQDRETGQAYIDIILGDAPIHLPDEYEVTSTDYLNWMWSYNTLRYSFNSTTGRLQLEVL